MRLVSKKSSDYITIQPTDHGEGVGGVRGALFVGGEVALEHEGDGESEIGAKDVDEHRGADVGHLEDLQAEMFVGGKDGDLADGHNDQLQRSGDAQNGAEGDEHAGRGEIRVQ